MNEIFQIFVFREREKENKGAKTDVRQFFTFIEGKAVPLQA